jgi:hypothetical protein
MKQQAGASRPAAFVDSRKFPVRNARVRSGPAAAGRQAGRIFYGPWPDRHVKTVLPAKRRRRSSGPFGQDGGDYYVHDANDGREQGDNNLENQRTAAGFLLNERHNRSHHDDDERYHKEYYSKCIDKLLHDSSHLLLKPVLSQLTFVPGPQ